MSNWDRRFEERPGTTSALMIVGAVVFLLLLCWSIVAVGFGLRVATAGLVGRGQAHITIQSGSNRIAQYDKFFNTCASIQGLEGSIFELERSYASAPPADNFEASQRVSNLAGLRALRRQAIAQYNADAAKSYTNGQFRSSDLPYQINAEGTKTSCVY